MSFERLSGERRARSEPPKLWREYAHDMVAPLLRLGEGEGYFKIYDHMFFARRENGVPDVLMSGVDPLRILLRRRLVPGIRLTYVRDQGGEVIPDPEKNSVFIPLRAFKNERPLSIVPAPISNPQEKNTLQVVREERANRIAVMLPSVVEIARYWTPIAFITYDKRADTLSLTSNDQEDFWLIALPLRWEDSQVPEALKERREVVGPIRVRSVGMTNVGRVREDNEDSFSLTDGLEGKEKSGIFVVADGVGGSARGGDAAQLVTRIMPEVYRRESDEQPGLGLIDRLRSVIRLVNQRVASTLDATRSPFPSLTTAASLVLEHKQVVIGHVGDSRIYVFPSNNRLVRLTEDHSLAALRVQCSDDDSIPFGRNTLTQAIGYGEGDEDERVHPAVMSFPAARGDIYLLASDGLWNEVPDERIAEILSKVRIDSSLDDVARELVASANDAGAHDNITVVLVSIE